MIQVKTGASSASKIKNPIMLAETFAVLSFLIRSQAMRDGERPSTLPDFATAVSVLIYGEIPSI